MSFLEWLSYKRSPLMYLLRMSVNDITFHYRARATKPDQILVYERNSMRLLHTYNWIDGLESHPATPLGRVHSVYAGRHEMSTEL